jgi:hypothetical protein
MNIHNLNALIQVRCVDKIKSGLRIYKPAKRIFGIEIQRAGVYGFGIGGYHYISSEPSQTEIIVDGILYTKPFVFLRFTGDCHKVVYFDTIELARSYALTFVNNNNGNWMIDQSEKD